MDEETYTAMIAYIQSALITEGFAMDARLIDLILEAEDRFLEENGIVTFTMDDTSDDGVNEAMMDRVAEEFDDETEG